MTNYILPFSCVLCQFSLTCPIEACAKTIDKQTQRRHLRKANKLTEDKVETLCAKADGRKHEEMSIIQLPFKKWPFGFYVLFKATLTKFLAFSRPTDPNCQEISKCWGNFQYQNRMNFWPTPQNLTGNCKQDIVFEWSYLNMLWYIVYILWSIVLMCWCCLCWFLLSLNCCQKNYRIKP